MAMANELPQLEEKVDIAASTGTTQLLERAFLLLLFAVLLLGILAVLRPFITAILFGAILAIAARPAREVGSRLAERSRRARHRFETARQIHSWLAALRGGGDGGAGLWDKILPA